MNYLEFSEIGLSLDLDCMGFDTSLLAKMNPALDQAALAMSELEAGAIANPDENRMVGHYWLRNAELAPNKNVREEITRELEKIKEFEKSCAFKYVLCIGIGGSALGPQFLENALYEKDQKRKLFFLDNTDPEGIKITLSKIPSLKDTLLILTSKSGNTVESRNTYLEVAEEFTRAGLNVPRQSIAITCASSALDKQAKSENWLACFYIWDWVGGRTSISSSVGMLPLTLAGKSGEDFLLGAKLMDQATRIAALEKNPAALLALSWFNAGAGLGNKSMVVLPYSDRLELFSRYLQQLVMESLGKEKDLNGKVVAQGLTVYGNKGATDQHAYIQQLRDGRDDFFVSFIEVLSDSSACEVESGINAGDYLYSFLEGTKKALREKGRLSLTITLNEVNEKTLGALVALYERAVGLYASLINVNAYNQPGVDAGKKAASEIIELQKRIKAALVKTPALKNDHQKLARELSADPALTFRILRRLVFNKSV